MAWSILEEDRHRWPTISTDKKEKGLAQIERAATNNTPVSANLTDKQWDAFYASGTDSTPGDWLERSQRKTTLGQKLTGEGAKYEWNTDMGTNEAAVPTGQSMGASIAGSVAKALIQKALSPKPKQVQPPTSANIGAGNAVQGYRPGDEENPHMWHIG